MTKKKHFFRFLLHSIIYKKSNYPISLIILSFYLFNTHSYCQISIYSNVQISELFPASKLKGSVKNIRLINSKNDSELYILNFRKSPYLINTSDKKTKKKIVFTGGKPGKIIDCVTLNEKHYLISLKGDKIIFHLLTPSTQKAELAGSQFISGSNKYDPEIRVVADSSLLVIIKKARKKDLFGDHEFTMIDQKLTKLWNYSFQAININKYEISDILCPNLNNLIISCRELKEETDPKALTKFQIVHFNAITKKTQQHELTLPNKSITDVAFGLTKQEELMAIGNYSNLNSNLMYGINTDYITFRSISGCFRAIFKSNNASPIVSYSVSKTIDRYLYNRRLQCGYNMHEVITDIKFNNVLIAETYFGKLVQRTTFDQKGRPNVVNAIWTWTGSPLITKIDSSGNTLWSTIIPKGYSQHSFVFMHNNDSYVFAYNDTISSKMQSLSFKGGTKTVTTLIPTICAVASNGTKSIHYLSKEKGWIDLDFQLTSPSKKYHLLLIKTNKGKSYYLIETS